MNRRDAIKQTSLILGSAVSASVAMGVLNGCQPSYAIDWEPSFLSKDQAILVGEIAETILPQTETSGAKALHLDEFVDLMLKEVFTAKEQTAFTTGLAELAQKCETTSGKSFLDCTAEERLDFLQKEEIALREKSAGASGKPTLLQLKELTLVGFFTSEYVGKEVLNFQPVPGKFEGCAPYDGGAAEIGLRI